VICFFPSSCKILTLHFSSKTQARLDSLVTSAKDDSAKIQHLQDQLEHLGQGLSIESLTPNAQNQLRLLLGLSERACDVIAQHRILESIAFEGMYGRYEDVDEAHFETLQWIYGDDLYTDEEDEDSADDEVEEVDEDSADDETYKEDEDSADDEAGDIDEDEYEDEEKTSARELLLNWISSGAGIFHISGKLGSGKSTLMKYLSDHNCTGELLGQWAGSSLRYFIFIVPRTNYYNKANVN
jgi:hypothetical protein